MLHRPFDGFAGQLAHRAAIIRAVQHRMHIHTGVFSQIVMQQTTRRAMIAQLVTIEIGRKQHRSLLDAPVRIIVVQHLGQRGKCLARGLFIMRHVKQPVRVAFRHIPGQQPPQKRPIRRHAQLRRHILRVNQRMNCRDLVPHQDQRLLDIALPVHRRLRMHLAKILRVEKPVWRKAKRDALGQIMQDRIDLACPDLQPGGFAVPGAIENRIRVWRLRIGRVLRPRQKRRRANFGRPCRCQSHELGIKKDRGSQGFRQNVTGNH